MAKVYGTEEMIRRLLAIDNAMEAEAGRAMEKNGQELVAMQKRLVGKDSHDLEASIKFEHVEFKKGAGIRVTAGSEQAYYARWHEHGTADTPANPFFFGSYRALKRRFTSRVTRWCRNAIRRMT